MNCCLSQRNRPVGCFVFLLFLCIVMQAGMVVDRKEERNSSILFAETELIQAVPVVSENSGFDSFLEFNNYTCGFYSTASTF